MGQGTGLAGIAAILLIGFALSSDRRAIRLRVVGSALALQALMAWCVLATGWGRGLIGAMSEAVSGLLGYARTGTEFVFGSLAGPGIGGTSFAIAALPPIIFFSALISVLYHLGIMRLVIRWVGGAIRFVTGVSRTESLCAASNIFVGQSESPLVIRPYLSTLSAPGLFAVMTVGMAGVAGTILGAYTSMIGEQLLPYLLAASFMSAPGGLAMAKLMMPDDRTAPDRDMPETIGHGPDRAANIIMAAADGAMTGVRLAVAVAAMVLAFVALIALANGLLGWAGGILGWPGLSFQMLLGQVFRPVMWLIGIDWAEAGTAGGLFGAKIVLNEFVAFIELARLQAELSPRTVAIVTFALCGFANFASIAIQMAVTGTLAPTQRPMIARLGLRALIAASLANLMSAAMAGLML